MAVADFAQGVTSANYWAQHLNGLKPQSKSAVTASTDTSPANSGKPLITTGADGKSFFQNVLDIVNPLEHLPVVSTIYDAITGNKSGDLEKMAGDTLYGGVIGLASSVANIAFEKITGKDFGDTVLSMVGLGHDDKNAALASAKTPSTQTSVTAALNKASLPPATKIAQKAGAMPFVTSVSPVAPIATAAPAQLTMPSSAAPAKKLASVDTAPVTTAPANTQAQSVIDISPQTDALLASLQKNGITGAMQTQALDAYRRTMTMNSQQSATVH